MAWPNDVYDPYSNDQNRFSLFGGQPEGGAAQPSDTYQSGPRQPLGFPGQTPQVTSMADQFSPSQLASPPPAAPQADPYTTWFNQMQAMYGRPSQPDAQQTTGLFGGNRFSTLTGMMANAISPYSWGGRLGGAVANMNMMDNYYGGYGRGGYGGYGRGRGAGNPLDWMAQPLVTKPGEAVTYPWNFGNPNAQPYVPVPSATPMTASRPAYGGYAAVPGHLPLKPGETAYTPGAEDQYTAPLLPSQAAPPATPRTASRPAYTNPQTGEDYPAVGPLFSPREEAVVGSPGSTIIPAPGQPPVVAAPTYRQSTATVGPGGSVVQGGRVVATGPTTNRQNATGEAGGKPTVHDQEVEALARRMDGMTDQEKAAFLAKAPAGLQMRIMEAKQRNFDRRRADILAGIGGGQIAQPRLPAALKGQRTNRPDGTYNGPYGPVTVKGGIIQ